MKLFTKCMTAVAVSILATGAFAQEELRDAVDAGDIVAAQKIVKKGKIEEVYCGKLTPDEAVRVYARVRARRAVDADVSALKVCERLLDDLLYADGGFLVLPARVRRTVVGDDDFVFTFQLTLNSS